jgi:SRSO17 transposase
MTSAQIQAVGPAFTAFLKPFRPHCGLAPVARHVRVYCQGLLSDLPRKSVEPIALAAGTPPRTLQRFLTTRKWDQDGVRDELQRQLRQHLRHRPRDPLGVVGVIDETSDDKKGAKTPGVQRQYLGCEGKVDNGIVTVHLGVAAGRLHTLVDRDLYLPKSWCADAERCHAAGIPEGVAFRTKWQIALDQWLHAARNGLRFDWLTFDEGYGAMVPLLTVFTLVGQKFVGEIPVNFRVDTPRGPRRVDQVLSKRKATRGRRYRLKRETVTDPIWRAVRKPVGVQGRRYTLIVAINEATGEVKYFLANGRASLKRLLAVAFRRWTVEHSFRVAKSEIGLMHFEGRHYAGLLRHLTLSLLVMLFVAVHTDRLRGEKSRGDAGASLSGVESVLPNAFAEVSRTLAA